MDVRVTGVRLVTGRLLAAVSAQCAEVNSPPGVFGERKTTHALVCTV